MDPDKVISIIKPDVGGRETDERKRRKQLKSLALQKLTEFADSTTLHGLRYITQRGLHPVEKIFWLITFIISVLTCFYLMSNVWMKWTTSPVIVSLSETLVSVDEVPFPSVTICPQTKNVSSKYNYFKTQKQLLKLVTEKNTNTTNTTMSQKDLDMFFDLNLICNAELPFRIMDLEGRNFTNVSLIENIDKVAPKFYDITFNDCSWRDEEVDCDELFKKVITSEGVCYTMNTLAASEVFRIENVHNDFKYLEETRTSFNWTREEGYLDQECNAYPKRGRQNGALPDLSVTLKEDLDEKDHLCNSFHNGFKVFIHHPSDLPQPSLYYYSVLPSLLSSMAVEFELSTTSENLKSIPVDKRQCYFPGERYLRYFQGYSPNNCKMECLTNHTFFKCGCVGFYMPFHVSNRICTKRQLKCMRNAQEELAREKGKESSSNRGCNCLPSCDNIYYDSEILKSEFNIIKYWRELSNSLGFDDDLTDRAFNNKTFSRIELFYKKPQFMSYKRSELFGKTDFIANCGGLLGLFLGFSFLSLVEIIYFITLRIWCALGRDSQEQK